MSDLSELPKQLLDHSTVIREYLEPVAVYGGKLWSAWDSWSTKNRIARLESTMKAIAEKLALLPPNVFAESDAGQQLLELVLREAEIEHSDAKRERLANLLVSSWIRGEVPEVVFDESLLFLRATTEFTESHVAVLDALATAGRKGSTTFVDLAKIAAGTTLQEVEAKQIAIIVLDDLCSRYVFANRAWGLNEPDAKMTILSSENLSAEGIARNCRHAITARGERFVEYVLDGPGKDSIPS